MQSMRSAILFTLFIFFSAHIAWAKLPYVPIEFPRADGAHYEDAPTLTEWWYFNGKVTTREGRNFGYYIIYSFFQTTLFGCAVRTPCFVIQITDIDKQKVYGINKFMLPIQRLETQNLDIMFANELTLQNKGGVYLVNATAKSKQGPVLTLSLQLLPERPAVLNNGTGYSDGWGDSSMYYYSQPHLNTAGSIQIDNEKFTIDPQQSLSWMNRQWTDMLIGHQTQWQWANVQLKNGIDLDIWQSVDPDTGKIGGHGANILMPDGSTVFTNNLTYTPLDHPGHKYPQAYHLEIPEINLHLLLNALVPDQDVNGFWEGVSEVTGIYNGKAVSGQGYTENTTKKNGVL